MYNLNQQTFIELLACAKHTETLDWMAACKELLDALRKEVVDRDTNQSQAFSPLWLQEKEGSRKRDTLDDIQDLDTHVHVYKTYV